jgi:hypothetical protein
VESALLLASLRRMVRPSDLPPLPKIRSLAYFQPVITELQQQPLPEGYLDYLRLKFQKCPTLWRVMFRKLRRQSLGPERAETTHDAVAEPLCRPTRRARLSDYRESADLGELFPRVGFIVTNLARRSRPGRRGCGTDEKNGPKAQGRWIRRILTGG